MTIGMMMTMMMMTMMMTKAMKTLEDLAEVVVDPSTQKARPDTLIDAAAPVSTLGLPPLSDPVPW